MTFQDKKGLAINPAAQTHCIDHLAVVAAIMDIPLLFIDEVDYALAQRYYPDVKTAVIAYEELTPEFLIADYDVLFFSSLWDRRSFHEKFALLEKKYNKVLRHVHCPHGFSDKAFHLMQTANEDIALIYGQNMLDMLKQHNVLQDLPYYIVVGNYRYTYFKKYKLFFDKIIQEEVLSHFYEQKPVILYAPTWLDKEKSTSFFDAYDEILGNLSSDYNMIVKLHPHLEPDDPGLYYKIVGKYEKKPNILFLKDFTLVYPLLELAAIYIGDMSSVGYDFLAFNKPMFFLNTKRRDARTDKGLFLFRCGVEILPENYKDLYAIIDANLEKDQEKFSQIRREVYEYTFGKERSFADIKSAIIAACNTELKL